MIAKNLFIAVIIIDNLMLFSFVVALCPPLASPYRGSVNSQDFSVGSRVTFSCQDGYKLTDEQPLVCTVELQWSGLVPSCIGK